MAIGFTHNGNTAILDANPNADENYGSRPNTLVFSDANTPSNVLASYYTLISTVPKYYMYRDVGTVREMTAQEKSTFDAAQAAGIIATAKVGAKTIYDALDATARLVRAGDKLTVDEINLVREWIVSFKAAVAAATSLANLQTRVAALNDMPDRTYAQAKTAIGNIIDGE